MLQGKLELSEKVRLDNDRLNELYDRLGPNGAEDFISAKMEELAIQLARLGRDYETGRLSGTRHAAEQINALADQIGMTMVAHVARDVGALTQRNDPTALAATVARLERVGETSLMAGWDIQGLSG